MIILHSLKYILSTYKVSSTRVDSGNSVLNKIVLVSDLLDSSGTLAIKDRKSSFFRMIHAILNSCLTLSVK